jgi:hypothetical protein
MSAFAEVGPPIKRYTAEKEIFSWGGFADSRPVVEPRMAPVYLEATTNAAWKAWTEDNKAEYLGQSFQ